VAVKVALTKSINAILVPKLKERGFTIKDGTEDVPAWKEGCFLRRVSEGREEAILVGRDKFGGALAFTVVRQRQDGSSAYMDWHNRGLTRHRLRYASQDELDALLEYLVQYFDAQVVPWLASVP
jgi:hypothetical protein